MCAVSAAGALAACSGSDGATIEATSDGGNGTTGVKAGGTKGSGDAGGDDEDDDASTAGGGGDAGGSKGDAGATADGGHPAVDAGPPSGHETGQKLTVDGTTRTYDISVPLQCTASTKVPLVFILHGDGGKGSDMYGSAFPIEAAAAAAGGEAIFVYPDGLNNNQNGSAWNIYDNPSVFPYDGGDPTKNDDVDYFDALVKSLGAMACADASRVFVTGFSNGGYMTNQLARWRAGVVKAAAPQSGGPPAGSTDSDYPTAPYCVGVTGAVPTLIVHGTNDGTVDFSLGQQAASYWDMANGCAKASSDCSSSSNTLVTPPVTPTTATSPNPCVTSTGCMSGEPVISCFISGMGHQIWSAAPTAIWALFASVSGS
jgi:polyhydroxybutyrate depolymerase